MKKSIRDYDLEGKTVIIRVDFNVPMKNGVITDDNRIVESLETINYATSHGAKVVLLSHLGRIKTEEDKKGKSLAPVAARLDQLLGGGMVTFVSETRGSLVEKAISEAKFGDVVLLENTRFEDVNGKKESKNDSSLGAYWASLGDLYINDAFGTAHRAHASNVGIASLLPSGVGFLVEKELNCLVPAIEEPEKPFTVILGGAKVSDKIGVVRNLVKKADFIAVGGGMSNTFLKAMGYELGASLVDDENLQFCNEILSQYRDKIILPVDFVCTTNIESNQGELVKLGHIKPDQMAVDVGPETVQLFRQYLDISKTIIWNGTLGVTEYSSFSDGTKAICEILKANDGVTILGGGDTAAAAINFGYKNAFTHISTGGGASLDLLAGETLPGIAAIDDVCPQKRMSM